MIYGRKFGTALTLEVFQPVKPNGFDIVMTAKLIVRAGKVHGWPEMIKDEEIFADWFDEHLYGTKPVAGTWSCRARFS